MTNIKKMERKTTISCSWLEKTRLQSILKYGETEEIGLQMLLDVFDKPPTKTYEIYGNRTIFPSITTEERTALHKELAEKVHAEPLRTPKQIRAEEQLEE